MTGSGQASKESTELHPKTGKPTHLLVLVNGVWGSYKDWNAVIKKLDARLDRPGTQVLVSKANSKRKASSV